MTRRDEVRQTVDELPVLQFSLRNVYQAERAKGRAANDSEEATIRRVLQELRDEGHVRFLDNNGHYEKVALAQSLGTSAPTGQAGPPSLEDDGTAALLPLFERARSSVVTHPAVTREALEREQDLVTAFSRHLVALRRPAAVIVRIPRAGGYFLFTDAYDKSTETLYEAKSDASREHVRMAIGQLLDYRYLLRNEPVRVTSISLLLPERPTPDICDLLRSLNIGCTYRTDTGFADISA